MSGWFILCFVVSGLALATGLILKLVRAFKRNDKKVSTEPVKRKVTGLEDYNYVYRNIEDGK